MRTLLLLVALSLTMVSNVVLAEVWRVAELLSEGPPFGIVEGEQVYCENRFVVVIKMNGTDDRMYDVTGDPAYSEFQRAEKWIQKTYPGDVVNLELLKISFGWPVNADFPSEESVFKEMYRQNFGQYQRKCNKTFNIKKSKNSYGASSHGN